MANSSTDATTSEATSIDRRNPLLRLVQLRWKHALVAFILGTTTYALYTVGGWTIDTAVFGITTLAVIVYSALMYRSDAR